jgi:hypothetical protein
MRLSHLLILAACLAPLVPARGVAQSPASPFDDYRELVSFADEAPRVAPPSTSTPRLPLFGMTSFLKNPIDIDDTDTSDSDGDSGMIVSFGRYLPNFDSNPTAERRPQGYQKAHAQMQVADLGPTSVFVTVQTLTPGDGADGIARGPTTVSPSFGVFHDLGYGVGIQGFLGQDVEAHSRWSDGLGTRVRAGVGMQYPVPGLSSDIGDTGWFFLLEARGYYRYDDASDGVSWKVAPGVHWRASDACWLSLTASKYSIVSFLYRY